MVMSVFELLLTKVKHVLIGEKFNSKGCVTAQQDEQNLKNQLGNSHFLNKPLTTFFA
jgi:hypothetical protein